MKNAHFHDTPDTPDTPTRRTVLALGLLALSGAAGAQGASQTARIIVPFAAGGARDVPARLLQHDLNRETSQNWIIENKPGAGGAIGTAFVANAPADGMTLLMAASSHFVTAAMGATPKYEPVKDFAPVALVGHQTYVLIVPTSLNVKTVGELVATAKRQPGVLNYGSAGIASSTHLAAAYLTKRAGIDMVHVPFKGTQEAANDVVAGRSQMVFVPTAGVSVYLKDPRVRIIGTTGAKRAKLLPDVPTLEESGLPGYRFESWFGLLAPDATPPAVIEKLNAAVNKLVVSKEIRERLESAGIEPNPMSTAAFGKIFLADRELMAAIVKDSGIRKE